MIDGEIAEVQPPAPQPAVPQPFNFKFSGDGGEFFRIWIVNICLTILTLGIYSAWAKVRTTQYFYGHTDLGGSSFQYLATPLSILIGRLIAVGLFVLYVALASVNPMLDMVMGVMLLLLFPWLVVRAMRFRMRNTAYRNVRFDFDGTYAGVIRVFGGGYLLVVFTLGLALPWWLKATKTYLINHIRFGDQRFNCSAETGPFYVAALVVILISVVFVLVGVAVFWIPLLGQLALIAGYLMIFAYWQATIRNQLFNTTAIGGDCQLASQVGLVDLWVLYLTNALLVIFTLGFAIPWVLVRTARFYAQSTQLKAVDLDHAVAAAVPQSTSAVGEEIAEVFAVDIGI